MRMIWNLFHILSSPVWLPYFKPIYSCVVVLGLLQLCSYPCGTYYYLRKHKSKNFLEKITFNHKLGQKKLPLPYVFGVENLEETFRRQHHRRRRRHRTLEELRKIVHATRTKSETFWDLSPLLTLLHSMQISVPPAAATMKVTTSDTKR